MTRMSSVVVMQSLDRLVPDVFAAGTGTAVSAHLVLWAPDHRRATIHGRFAVDDDTPHLGLWVVGGPAAVRPTKGCVDRTVFAAGVGQVKTGTGLRKRDILENDDNWQFKINLLDILK